jgi:large conductance mechanosensitive channel
MDTVKDVKNSLGAGSTKAKTKAFGLLAEFRIFMLRGNVVDLAIAVIIGAAFGAVISGLVEDLITPLIAAFGGNPDFSGLTFTVNGSVFRYGHFVNQIISFIIIGLVVFFLIVRPLNGLVRKHMSEVATGFCPECLSEVPLKAKKCPHCTSQMNPIPK